MSAAIRPATPDDLPAALILLQDAELPTEDLRPEHLALVAEGDVGMLGIIGIEPFGPIALMRSLVVVPLERSQGVGRKLVTALETTAAEKGVRQLWLLTIDAGEFFRELGFAVRSRDEAPDAIRNSAEYSRLCPGDAVLMSKHLGERPKGK